MSREMFLTKSTEYEMMRSKLHDIRQVHEIARILGPAQDNLYASICAVIARHSFI